MSTIEQQATASPVSGLDSEPSSDGSRLDGNADRAARVEGGANEAEQDEQREPCPTPLSWTNVVRLFEEGSRRHEVDHGKRRLRGWSWGDVDAPCWMLLGGATAAPRMLALLAHLLREEFHVVVVEDPVDESPAAGGLPDFASGVVAIADACGVERFSLFGSGWGTMVGLRTLLDQPRRAERAVLTGAFARTRYSLAERLAFRSARWLPGRVGTVPLARTLLEQSHRRWFPPFDHSRWQFFVDATTAVPLRTVGARTAAAMNADLRPEVGDISQPVLIIRPEGEGRMAAAAADELAAELPNVRVEPMHNTGHYPYLTHPHRIAKFVKTFAAATSSAN